MKFLRKLAKGDVALWRAFWLLGIPLALIWDLSGTCTAVGCGIQDPMGGLFLMVLFTLTSIGIPFAAVAIWRSASNYPRAGWPQTLIAWCAKLSAVVSACLAVIGLLVVLYIAGIFIYAMFDRY